MEQKQTYNKVSKHTHGFINWLISLFREIKNQLKKTFLGFKEMYLGFYQDIKNGSWTKRIASVMAISFVSWYLIYLPVSGIIEWGFWKYRDWTIQYTEYKFPEKSSIEKEVGNFAKEYSDAYGTSCEWFKRHDVDIGMWQKYQRLHRPSYECAGFSAHNRVLLYPIYISSLKESDGIVSLEARFARIDYNEEVANRYTTVKTTLWRLADEKDIWRIHKMDNSQKWRLLDDK